MGWDRFYGCILGVAIGDALGMPFETMTVKEIEKWGGDVSKDFLSSEINPHPFPDAVSLPPGSWTDDTQLTLAIIEAIIESRGAFNMDAIARHHVLAFEKYRGVGWGRSTRNACKRLQERFHWEMSGELNGGGNGVVMKIAPIGLLQSEALTREDIFQENCIDLGRMTHGEPSAIIAGYVHAAAICLLTLSPQGCLPANFLVKIFSLALKAEELIGDEEKKTSSMLRKISDMNLLAETPATLAPKFGGGSKEAFRAVNSLGLSYAIFLRDPLHFDSVFDAIRAGGDTDSNASIVASMLGTLHGSKIIPPRFVEKVADAELIRRRAVDLFTAVQCSVKSI
jgi:ADP-ribosyl-[dinitrogen reductase] hydrolase